MPFRKTVVTDSTTGVQFNDYDRMDPTLMGLETDDTRLDYGSQVCAEHAQQLHLADGLIKDVGSGQCGIVGCDNPATHNYFFFSDQVPLEEREVEGGEGEVGGVPPAQKTVPVKSYSRRTPKTAPPTSIQGVG